MNHEQKVSVLKNLFRRAKRGTKQYGFADRAGCVQIRKCRKTGTEVGVYHSLQSGIESDPKTPWVTVCEKHTACVCHSSLDRAKGWASDPTMWCEDCRKEAEQKILDLIHSK